MQQTSHQGAIMAHDDGTEFGFRQLCIQLISRNNQRFFQLINLPATSRKQVECLTRVQSSGLFTYAREVKLEMGRPVLEREQLEPALTFYLDIVKNRRGLLRNFCLTLTEVAIQIGHLHDEERPLRERYGDTLGKTAEGAKQFREPRRFLSRLHRELLLILRTTTFYSGVREWQVSPAVAGHLMRELKSELLVMRNARASSRLSEEVKLEVDALVAHQLFQDFNFLLEKPVPRDPEKVVALYRGTLLDTATKQWGEARELIVSLYGHYEALRHRLRGVADEDERKLLVIGAKLIWVCILHLERSGVLLTPHR